MDVAYERHQTVASVGRMGGGDGRGGEKVGRGLGKQLLETDGKLVMG